MGGIRFEAAICRRSWTNALSVIFAQYIQNADHDFARLLFVHLLLLLFLAKKFLFGGV